MFSNSSEPRAFLSTAIITVPSLSTSQETDPQIVSEPSDDLRLEFDGFDGFYTFSSGEFKMKEEETMESSAFTPDLLLDSSKVEVAYPALRT